MKNHQTQTTTGALKGGRLESKSRSVEATSALISSGLFSLLLLAWLCCLSLGLFAWSSEAYEAFTGLPVLDQFAAVTAFAVFALGFAATVREFRTDFGERWAARLMGAAGVVFLIAFAYRMTVQVDRLQNQIAAKGVTSARQIATMDINTEGSSQRAPTPANGIAARPSGTSVTYDIGRNRTVTITEPWRWCADRSVSGGAECSQWNTGGNNCVECPKDGSGKCAGPEGRFTVGAIGDLGRMPFKESRTGSASESASF